MDSGLRPTSWILQWVYDSTQQDLADGFRQRLRQGIPQKAWQINNDTVSPCPRWEKIKSSLTLLGVCLTVWKACASPPVSQRLYLLLTKKGKWSVGIAISDTYSCAGFQLLCKLGWADAVDSHRISCSGQLKIRLQERCNVTSKEHSQKDHLSCKVALTLHTSFKRI